MGKSKISRRNFMLSSAMGAAAGAAIIGTSQTSWAGANGDIRVAVAGIRGQGGGHIGRYLEIPGVRVVALCDPDQAILDMRLKELADKGIKAKGYRDVRELIDDKDIDAISTASPNHWHALITIWACQAGKDVYVEKPCSHNVWEGRKIVEAARKYNRIVQIGTQTRSDHGVQEGLKWIKDGNLGKILLARGLCYKRRESIGKVKGPQKPPETLDYDLWTGPARMEPLMRKRLHYDWHWVNNTGNGDIGNQGIHQMDVARWALGVEGLPPRVMSVGGRFGYDDDGNTPNTQMTFYDYPDAPLIFEVRGLPIKSGVKASPHFKGIRIGNVIHCEGGYFACGTSGGSAYDSDGKKVKKFEAGGAGDHQSNFIDVVRSRKESDLNAPIEGGHVSSALCHLGGISHRLGTRSSEAEIRKAIEDKPDAIETFDRFKEHLEANNLEVDKLMPELGPWLNFDNDTERFVGNEKSLELVANSMLSRNYREPFVVPENV